MVAKVTRGQRYIRAAGVSAWVLSGVPALLILLGLSWAGLQGAELGLRAFVAWAAGWLLFIVSFWVTSAGISDVSKRRRNRILLLVQTIAAFWMFHYVCTGLETTLLAVVAAQLGVYARLPIGLLWLSLQTLALGLLGLLHWNPLLSVGWVALTLPFQVLAFFTSYFAASEQEAKLELTRAVAELRATQELLGESTRVGERTRISREMHDLLGHHLTALSLNLEVAKHRSSGETKVYVEKCQELAKKLLNDLREVVRSLRGDQSVDLGRVLKPLTADIPHPRIHLSVPNDVRVYDPERAHALVRCVQEIVTNAVKHASAENLWIDLVKEEGKLEVRAWDDGRGAGQVREGHGLKGMRERLEHLGGQLEINAVPSGGFRLRAFIPLPGAPA